MKIITLHSDYIRYEPIKKAIKEPEEVKKGIVEIKECLVVLTSVEKSDESYPEAIVDKLIAELKSICTQIKTNNVVIYPYAHLSSNLANPNKALEILKSAEKKLSSYFTITRAPFGWYKSLELKCKGHPLAELSREIQLEPKKEESISQAITSEKKLKSYWYIMEIDGRLVDIDKYDFANHKKLKTFAFYEKVKDRRVSEEPLHVKAMKKLELVDYEPGSDSGNMRYYPNGRLIKSLLESYV
ncbi:MAG: threonyl-tRNA synthetase editing domain-containing protein, partial [Nanoarchaeota archaeon]